MLAVKLLPLPNHSPGKREAVDIYWAHSVLWVIPEKRQSVYIYIYVYNIVLTQQLSDLTYKDVHTCPCCTHWCQGHRSTGGPCNDVTQRHGTVCGTTNSSSSSRHDSQPCMKQTLLATLTNQNSLNNGYDILQYKFFHLPPFQKKACRTPVQGILNVLVPLFSPQLTRLPKEWNRVWSTTRNPTTVEKFTCAAQLQPNTG